MRGRRLRAALSGLALLCSLSIAPAEDRPPVAVIGSFTDPGTSEEVLFSAGGHVVAMPDLGLLWDADSGLPLRRLLEPVFTTASAFTPDGRVFITGHKDGAIRLWSVASGVVLAKLPMPSDADSRINSLWTDSKGTLLVSGDHLGTVRVWSLASRRQVLKVEVRPPEKGNGAPNIVAARFSSDGDRLIVLANWYGQPGLATEYDARSGAERSWVRLPAKYGFPDHGYVDDASAAVIDTSECERGVTRLWGFKERAIVADVHRPERCDRDKEKFEPEAVKIFQSAQPARMLVVQGDAPELLVWDMAARKLDKAIRWPDQTPSPNVIGVSPDLKSVAVAEPGVVRIRALDTGASIKDLRGFGPPARNVVARDPDMQLVLQRAVRDGEKPAIDIDIWAGALPPQSLHFAEDGDFTVHDFSPAAKIALAGSENGEVLVLPLEPGRQPRKLVVENLRDLWRGWLSPDGKRAALMGQFGKDADSASLEGVLIDTADGAIRQRFESHEDNDEVKAFAFTSDGTRLAVGRRNGKVEIWDAAALKQIKVLPPAQEDTDVVSLSFSQDGRTLVGSSAFDGIAFAWNVATGKAHEFDLGPTRASYRFATAVAISRDGKTAAAGMGQRHTSSGDSGNERGSIAVINAATGKLRFTLRGARSTIYTLAFSPDDRLIVAGSLDGTIQYWDRETGRLMATAMGGASGAWLVLTESGFCAGSDGADQSIALVRGAAAIPASRVRAKLYQPSLVENLLKGDGSLYRAAARKLDLSELMKSAAP